MRKDVFILFLFVVCIIISCKKEDETKIQYDPPQIAHATNIENGTFEIFLDVNGDMVQDTITHVFFGANRVNSTVPGPEGPMIFTGTWEQLEDDRFVMDMEGSTGGGSSFSIVDTHNVAFQVDIKEETYLALTAGLQTEGDSISIVGKYNARHVQVGPGYQTVSLFETEIKSNGTYSSTTTVNNGIPQTQRGTWTNNDILNGDILLMEYKGKYYLAGPGAPMYLKISD